MGPEQGLNDQRLQNSLLNVDPEHDSIGAIFGNVSTTQFRFAITSPGVKRTGYTQTWHNDHGWVLGQIMELNLESKLTYTRAQELSMERWLSPGQHKNHSSEQYNFPNDAGDSNKLAGFVQIIGYRDRAGIVQLPSSPFNAGEPVYPASENLIKTVLGLDVDTKTGAYIGLLRNHDLKVHLGINSLVQKHMSVIAKTGSGKSYIVGILVEEFIKRKVPVVIIDPHGEYSSLMHPNIDEHDTRLMSKYGIQPRSYPEAIREYSLNPTVNLGSIALKLSNYGFSADGIGELLGLRGTGVQAAILYKALNRLMAKKQYFTLKELSGVIELDRNSAKWHLINSLENLMAIGIFSNEPTPLTELVQPGRVTIINLRGAPPHQQQLVVTQLTRQLFEARKLNKVPAMMLVLEEAHQFCPQQGRARSSNVIHTIASEGRKFGLGLCVVSQRPAMVNKNVLSQCNTQVILKVTNPNDLKAIIASVEGLTTATIDEIQRLPVSVGIVIGGGIQVPIFVDVRVRETKHGGRPVDIFTNVDTFQAVQTMEDEELEGSLYEREEQLDLEIPQAMYSNEIDFDAADDEGPNQNIIRKEITSEDVSEAEQYSASEQFAKLKNKNKLLKSIISKTESISRSHSKTNSDSDTPDDLPRFTSMKEIMDSESAQARSHPRRKKDG
ncbi:ATP-binding protein [[Eubacterium] cellulosolvens]